MNRLTAIILMACALAANAADRIKATITVTNTPTTNGMTLVVNGDTRTWTNSVGDAATDILTNNSIGGIATNLFNHIAATPFAGPIILVRNGTNAVDLWGQVGQAMSVATDGGTWDWATVTYSTQTVSTAMVVRVPITVETSAARQQEIASLVLSMVASTATNAFPSNSTALTNHVNLGGAQTLTNKTLASSTFNGGTITNANLTNLAGLSGTITGTLTNGTLTNTTLRKVTGGLTNATLDKCFATNLINYGLALRSPGSGTESEQFGTGASATGDYSVAVGSGALATNDASVCVGQDTIAHGNISVAIGYAAEATNRSVAVGGTATAYYTNTVVLGYAAEDTADNQVVLGDGAMSVSAPANASIATNLAVGSSWETGWIASMVGGLLLKNGTAPTADATNSAALFVTGGELQYRAGATGEGTNVNNRVHNRGAEIVGSGSDYTLTAAHARVDFGGQDPEITLPTAGTYLVQAFCHFTGANATDNIYFKLHNSTDTSDISNSETHEDINVANDHQQLMLSSIITVTASKEIEIWGYNATAARGTVTAIYTKIWYVRLY